MAAVTVTRPKRRYSGQVGHGAREESDEKPQDWS